MSNPIEIFLKGSEVCIEPWDFQADHGKSAVKWKAKDQSDSFNFDDPPIVFIDPNAPMEKLSTVDGTASCIDSNNNSSGNNVAYAYRVRLIDGSGTQFTYPSTEEPTKNGHTKDGYPTISNKPK